LSRRALPVLTDEGECAFTNSEGSPESRQEVIDPGYLLGRIVTACNRKTPDELSLARRLRIVSRIGVVLEHLCHDRAADQRLELGLERFRLGFVVNLLAGDI
jgi:hypothetical protein